MRRSGEAAKDFAERHGVKSWYTSVNALLEDPEVIRDLGWGWGWVRDGVG